MAGPNILTDTAGMTEKDWLECRMHGPEGDIPYTVGGSDVATIFGLSPWTTPLELWLIKKGRIRPQPKDNAAQMEMGHLLEPVAAYWYEQKTGNMVIQDTNLYQHADHPYALANIDRRYINAADGEEGVLECKSCTYHKAGDWADEAIPIYYELQLRYYLAVMDLRIGSFSTLWGNNPDNDMAMPGLVRDMAKEEMIFERLEEWIWSLKNDKPPTMQDVKPRVALDSLARIYGSSKGDLPTVELSSKYEKPLRKLASIQDKITKKNQEIKKLEKDAEAYSVQIAEVMKQHEHGILETTEDKILIDFVTRKSRRPDSKLLKKDYPEVFDRVVKVSESRKVKVKIEAA